jgi:acetyltransferase
VDLQRLEEILVQLSQLILDHPCIKELDLNPLLAGPKGILALDARVLLHPASVSDDQLPKPAIRPYPSQYTWTWNSRYGKPLKIRPIRPEDEPQVAAFHAWLEAQGSYHEYLRRLHLPEGGAHEKLIRLCMNDFDRQITLVIEAEKQVVGVARLTRVQGTARAEFALQIAADWQGQGLGRQLLKRLIETGHGEGLRHIEANIYPGEEALLALCRKMGFDLEVKGNLTQAGLALGAVLV